MVITWRVLWSVNTKKRYNVLPHSSFYVFSPVWKSCSKVFTSRSTIPSNSVKSYSRCEAASFVFGQRSTSVAPLAALPGQFSNDSLVYYCPGSSSDAAITIGLCAHLQLLYSKGHPGTAAALSLLAHGLLNTQHKIALLPTIWTFASQVLGAPAQTTFD